MVWSTYRDIYWRFVRAYTENNRRDVWHLVDHTDLRICNSYYFNADNIRLDQAIERFLEDMNFGRHKEEHFGKEGSTPNQYPAYIRGYTNSKL